MIFQDVKSNQIYHECLVIFCGVFKDKILQFQHIYANIQIILLELDPPYFLVVGLVGKDTVDDEKPFGVYTLRTNSPNRKLNGYWYWEKVGLDVNNQVYSK